MWIQAGAGPGGQGLLAFGAEGTKKMRKETIGDLHNKNKPKSSQNCSNDRQEFATLGRPQPGDGSVEQD